MKHTISTTEAEVSIPKKKSKHNLTKNSSTSSTLPSLEAFFSSVFFNVVVQDDPAVVKLAYDTNVSRNFIEDADGVERNFKQDLTFLLTLHDTFSNLVLLSESFVISPSDSEGKAGQIASLHSVGAIENGSAVIVDIIEIVKVVFTSQGKRLIETVDNVFVSRPAGTAPPPTLAEMALQSFFGSAFFGTLIQDDDRVFELIFKRDYSPKVIEVDNGKPLTIQELHSFLINTRKVLFNRRLLSQSFVVNIGDSLGQTGQVAHSAKISAVQDGVEATASIVSVAEIIFVKNPNEVGGGHREILMKSFVFAVDG